MIDANVPGLSLNVDPSSGLGLANTGIMQASNGGLLLLNGNGGGGVNNAGGTITALDGSQVQLSKRNRHYRRNLNHDPGPVRSTT